jgi:glycosyltransferase involved in cell wall biosynthesis
MSDDAAQGRSRGAPVVETATAGTGAPETLGGGTPRRILFVIDELDVGGTEQQLAELVRRLDRRAWTPTVCCFRPGLIAREIEAGGTRVVVIRKRARVDPFLVLALTRLMRRERIDVVQTYLFTANTWGRLAAFLARVPAIVTAERNVTMWEERYKPVVGRWLDRFTAVTTGNSEAVRQYLVEKGLPARKVRVIYNGVNLARFDGPASPQMTRAELAIPPGHRVVGFVARLEPQKDPSTFLRAAARVVQRIPAVAFLMVGGGALRAQLEHEAEALGLRDRIIFTGARRDVPRLLAALDVSVLSSVKEGMSNTIMESMAAGLPMVATRVGGNAELVIDGETGYLVPPRDPERLAEAIERVLEDPARARAMGRAAQARIAERFSIDAMVASTTALYDELVRGAGEYPDAGAGAREPADVALVVSQFPRYVDAYFLREISALAARGVRFRILSLRGFGGRVIHEEARRLLTATVYVPFLFSWRLVRAQGRMLATAPRAYAGALGTVLRGYWRDPRSLLLSLAVFPKSVYFATLVQDEAIPHIHANWATHPATAALVMSRLTGVPWSFAGHASDIYLNTTMLADKIRDARFVVTCTRHNGDYLERMAPAGHGAKIRVSYHGVDLRKFRPAPARPDDGFHILAVGTLIECKGFPDLIEAARRLAQRGVEFDGTIVGDGPERRRLERLIAGAGLGDRLRLVGYVTQEELVPLYQRASVVVLPALSARHFGIPNVLLEALAAGVPVVCTPLPSLAEVFEDGTHGLYVPEGQPERLASALESLALDPGRSRRMGEAGRSRMEALFDVTENAAGLERLLLGGRARGTGEER